MLNRAGLLFISIYINDLRHRTDGNAIHYCEMSAYHAQEKTPPLQHHINQDSTAINIHRTELIPTSNVISSTFNIFLPLSVLHETSIPWRYERHASLSMHPLSC